MLRELNKKGVEDWAENNDANDSIEFSSDLVRDLVFELSSPEINGELSDERALQLIEILKSNRLSA
ncbi:hypothetical protein Lysil_1480 [Lysobacter silvestris]|uniref:Uncharacterized protein n=2 Tax=Solilutibacter silvestris TaxID=1645665 RepID=A0A2K1Q471_9GAMM|nr:hypothetical protein Lysil_1475 [Lysobacter silvestris]PNS09851.1 hypothetical protein Lysil_1480 [Lysobacter silvestris]